MNRLRETRKESGLAHSYKVTRFWNSIESSHMRNRADETSSSYVSFAVFWRHVVVRVGDNCECECGLHQENSIRLERLAPDTPDAARLPYLVRRHNDGRDAIKFSNFMPQNSVLTPENFLQTTTVSGTDCHNTS